MSASAPSSSVGACTSSSPEIDCGRTTRITPNEEWLLVVRGTPTLRTPEGEQDLSEGDVVGFRRGKDGAHQVSNRTDTPIRVLMLSTLIMPEIVEYLDTGKVGTRDAAGERIFLRRPGPHLGYWDGEGLAERFDRRRRDDPLRRCVPVRVQGYERVCLQLGEATYSAL